MKIRNGFVSNSSSSSFIVAIDHKPENSEDLRKMLFPGMNENDIHYHQLYNRTLSYTTKEISDAVFNDLSTDAKEIADAFGGYIEGSPEPEDFEDKEGKCNWDSYSNACNKFKNEYAAKILKKYEGLFVFTVTYSDNDGSWGEFMEHSDIFENVIHEQISQH